MSSTATKVSGTFFRTAVFLVFVAVLLYCLRRGQRREIILYDTKCLKNVYICSACYNKAANTRTSEMSIGSLALENLVAMELSSEAEALRDGQKRGSVHS
ncbi:hypothetical protein GWI33_023252 [Rhynchophorus ferrugineus]|uniref:Uncharacterized protein n=1 Tax=Rhynchophorus ferrugineus TaxID=354439 RepID=A0A834IM61_RHYFE|nr:hypothetical protein GWI33_023252 [Rhynchophorus ferrugineus]